jgi:putative tryptophan/tyrosine transport system substrate-binding protein
MINRLTKILICGLFAALLLPTAASAAGKPFHIVMVVWRGCEDACKGFQTYFKENKIPVKFTVRNAGRNKKTLPGFVAEAKAVKADLVVTWGTSVTRAVLGPYDKTDPAKHITKIPAVFMIVADPIGAKIVPNYESSGRDNITGTRNRAPATVQMKALQSYRKFKRLGMIYNTNELNAVLSVKAMRKIAKKMGFELVVEELPLEENGKPSPDSIEPTVAKLAKRGIDFLYVGSSSFLSKYRKPFTKIALDHKLAVTAGTEVLVTKGSGLLAIASRYYNVGQLAAFQAKRVLVDKIPPNKIKIRRLRRFSYIINMETARQLKMFPPLDLLRYAEVINGKPGS